MNEKFMHKALKLAQKSFMLDEVPIGAVVVCDGKVISSAYNTRNKTQNAINHAEVLAISKACKKLKSWRLENCDIYVTLEPCPMCAGAILNARIKNLYFGAYDKTSKNNLLHTIMQDERLNHKTNCIGGILQNECSQILTKFFKQKRDAK
ncbi:MAG: nucleoside deaminase [Clostridiales bacterium]|nr:nucleoside deaminase [Clostridiales bacterium]